MSYITRKVYEERMQSIFLIIAGILLLYFGAKVLVIGAKNIALALGISKIVIGLTVVAISTGSPELIVSLTAALKGAKAITVGNIIGSNIMNILLILGIALLISPVYRESELLKIEMPITLISTVAFAGFIFYGTIPRWGGALFLIGMIVTIYFQITHRRKIGTNGDPLPSPHRTWLQFVWIVLGAILLILGGEWFIKGSIQIARILHIPDDVIAVTLVAFGTSLPELATCIYTSIKRHPDLTLGNLIGSNIFNILGVIGICALISPLTISDNHLSIDAYVMVAATLLLYALLYKNPKLTRRTGVFLVLAYILYIGRVFT